MLAAGLTFDRSRQDLVEGIIQAVVAIVVGFMLLGGKPAIEVQATIYWLLWLGSALFGVRAFRGGFRQRRGHGHEADRK